MTSSAPFHLLGIEPVERLGSGGFGEVWLARQTNIDRMVAVKVGHTPIDDKTVQLRFERECIALGRLSGHRNIIEVFTAGQLPDNRPYLILEYISGGTMWERVHRDPLNEAEVIQIGIQLADALSIAHDTGVLHRDLKPENVFLRPNGEVVLGDFGIARLHDGANTTSQAIAASVAYAAPEILAGKPATVQADVYGLGICLVAAILRAVPFVEKTDESIHPIINRVLSAHPPDLRQYGISGALAALIVQTIAKDPGQRPPTAADVRDRLKQLSTGASAASTVIAPSQQDQASSTRRVGGPVPSLDALPPPPPSAGTVSNPQFNPFAGVPSPPAQPPPPQQVSPHQPPPQPPLQQVSPHQPPPQPPQQQVSPHQMSPHQPPPGGQRYTVSNPGIVPTPGVAGQGGQGGNGNRVYLFLAAFMATLLIGALILYMATQLGGDDTPTENIVGDGSAVSENTTSDDATSDSTDPSDATSPPPDAGTDTDADPPEPSSPDELVLPLTLDDLPDAYGADPLVESDLFGPGTPQFCGITPDTTGMAGWEGQYVSERTASSPSLFQEIVLFDTPENASNHIDSFMEGANCDEWTTPDPETGEDLTFKPVEATPVNYYGDDTRELTYEATSPAYPDFVVSGRLVIVQSGTQVFSFSVSSVNALHLNSIDGLVELSINRLGY